MDIECDIRIRNATPEELQRLFIGMQMERAVLGKLSRHKGAPQNFQNPIWSDEEKTAIAGCKDENEAWDRYHEGFPESARTRDAVRRKFQNLKDEEPAPAPEPEKKEPVKPVETAQAKLKKIAKPSKRDAAIKNAQAPRWTDPEKEIVKKHLDDPDFTGAWKEYQEKFPGQRNEHSVYLKWYAYKQQGKKDKPESGKKKIDARKIKQKIRPEHGFWNKWQIPFRSDTQKHEYQEAYALCRKYGKPYPEALALSQATGKKKPTKKTGGKQGGREIPCLYCKKILNSHGMHIHVKKRHPERFDEFMKTPDRLHHGIHTTPAPAKEVKEIPATRAPEVTTKSLQSDPGPAPIHQGDRVRHTTKYPLFPGIGTVKKISLKGDEVLVDFGSGTEWTDLKNLEVVPVEAKAS